MIDLKNIKKQIFYPEPSISTPFHTNKKIKITFADWIASGRPSPFIDNIITKEVLPYYSNTHSNAYCGTLMKQKIDETKQYIRKIYNLQDRHKIIFTGNGATGAINHISHSIDPKKFTKVNIFISMFEHHSNYLPWREMSRDFSNVTLYIVPVKNDNIDLNWLDIELNNVNSNNLNNNTLNKNLNIVSITGCSNVTGIITNIDDIHKIVNKYNGKYNNKSNYLLVDFACLAPYKKLDISKIDGVFISLHKFVGGTSTPGLLIADRSLFSLNHSFCPGGGCVKQADATNVIYYDDIEKRESGGTPNIVGIIRTKYVLELHQKLLKFINTNEPLITSYVHNKLINLTNKYKNFGFIYPNFQINNRLPIFAIFIDNMHYNLIVALFNDIFGIQTRGGISCCGMFGQLMKYKYKIDGWCRITFNYSMDISEINYILDSLEKIIKYGTYFKKLYIYDEKNNLFSIKDKQKSVDIDNNKLFEMLEKHK